MEWGEHGTCGGMLDTAKNYTLAQVALAQRLASLGGDWESLAWDLKKQTGLSMNAQALQKYWRRYRFPVGTIKVVNHQPQPPPRAILNAYLGIEDSAWWTWHPKSLNHRPSEVELDQVPDPTSPWDISFLRAPE